MLKFSISTSFVMLFFMMGPAAGQSVEDYFHTGANSYVNGRHQEAKQTLLEGLDRFPDDPMLAELLGRIKDEEKKNSQNQENQGQENPEQEQQEQEDQNKEEQQEEQEQQQAGEQEEDQKQDGSEAEEQEQRAEGEPKEISKEDAERILEALQNQEQDLLKKKKKAKARGAFRGKDW